MEVNFLWFPNNRRYNHPTHVVPTPVPSAMPRSPSPPILDPFPPLRGPNTTHTQRTRSYAAVASTSSQSRPVAAIATRTQARQVPLPSNASVVHEAGQPSAGGAGWDIDDVERNPALDDLGGVGGGIATRDQINADLMRIRSARVRSMAATGAERSGRVDVGPLHSAQAVPTTGNEVSTVPRPLAPYLTLDDILGSPSPTPASPSSNAEPSRSQPRPTRAPRRRQPARSNVIYTVNPDEQHDVWGFSDPYQEDTEAETPRGWFDSSSFAFTEDRGVPTGGRPWRSRFVDGVPADPRGGIAQPSANYRRALALDSAITEDRPLRARPSWAIASASEDTAQLNSTVLDRTQGIRTLRTVRSNITLTDPRNTQPPDIYPTTTNPPSRSSAANRPLTTEDIDRLLADDLAIRPSIPPVLEGGTERDSSDTESDNEVIPRRLSSLYTHSNARVDSDPTTHNYADGPDIEDGSHVDNSINTGSYVPGTLLRLGRNNRRRTSARHRALQAEQEILDRIVTAEMTESERGSRTPRSPGLPATNMEISRSIQPIIVSTSTSVQGDLNPSTKRGRQEDDEGVKEETESPKSKRRRLEPGSFSSRLSSFRPTYLSHSNLDLSTPLPGVFCPPSPDSHLSLYTSLEPISRPSTSVITTDLPPLTQIITYLPDPDPSGTETDSSSLRTLHPIPVECGVHYYEVEVLNSGDFGLMSVGWMKEGMNMRRMVGWNEGSWGFHSDDGRTFEGKGLGESYDRAWGLGDVIGCGVDFTLGKAFFTKNGKMIRHCFSKLGQGLHPAIGLKSSHESISINLTGPFQYDIDTYVQNVAAKVRDQALSSSFIPELVPRLSDQVIPGQDGPVVFDPERVKEMEGRDSIQRSTAALAMDYLRFSGYDRTLAVLKETMVSRGLLRSADSDVAKLPKNNPTSTASDDDEDTRSLADFSSPFAAISYITESIVHSDTRPIAWNLIIEIDPSFLELTTPSQTKLRNRLHLYTLIRKLRTAARARAEKSKEADTLDNEVIKFGQRLTAEVKSGKWDDEERRDLERVIGCVGCEVGDWDLGGISNVKRKEESAKELSSHLRHAMKTKGQSYLEKAVGQTILVQGRLARTVAPEATFLNVKQVLGL